MNVERGAFAPLVFSVNGAAVPASTAFLRRLCLLTSQSSGGFYSSLMGYYRCRVSFALLRSAVLCVRDARSARHRPVHIRIMLRELAMGESRVPLP